MGLKALMDKIMPGKPAEPAQQALSNRAYQLHVQEMKGAGEKPLTPEEFAKQNAK